MGMSIEELVAENDKLKRQLAYESTALTMMQADYNVRLKDDLVAVLEKLKEQLREMHEDFFETEHFDEAYGVSDSMDIIQQKINALRGTDNE